MSLSGNMAVAAQMLRLKELAGKLKDEGKGDAEILATLIREIELVKARADSGWL